MVIPCAMARQRHRRSAEPVDTERVLAFLASVVGVTLRGVFAALTLIRRPRPIHARGVVLTGTLRGLPPARDSGIAWVDDVAAATPVTVRVSRSLGLPSALPDILGFAARIHADGGPADLELASTGSGVPWRFALVPRRSVARATLGTLLPYRGAHGPVLLAARTESPSDLPADLADLVDTLRERPWHLGLFYATPVGHWERFATVTLDAGTTDDDASLRFDAVRRPLPGAGSYRWARLARQPSYLWVQDRSDASARRAPRHPVS